MRVMYARGMDPRPPIAEELKRAARLAKGRAMLRAFPMPQGILRQGMAPEGAEVIGCPPNAVEVEWLLAQTRAPKIHFRYQGEGEDRTFSANRHDLENLLRQVKSDVAHKPIPPGQCLRFSLWNDRTGNANAGRFPSLHMDAVTFHTGLLMQADAQTLRGISAHEAGHVLRNHAVRSASPKPVPGNLPFRHIKEFEADAVATSILGPEAASRPIALRLNNPKSAYHLGQWWMKKHPDLMAAKPMLDPLRLKLAVDDIFHAEGSYPSDAERLARNFGTDVETLIAPAPARAASADATRIDRPPTTPLRLSAASPKVRAP